MNDSNELIALKIKLYAWSRALLQDELSTDFSRLGRVLCASALAAREALARKSHEERIALTSIGLRVFHDDAARALGEIPTESEMQSFNLFRASYLSRAAEIRFKTRERPLKERKLRRLASVTLREAYGAPLKGTDRSLLRFSARRGSWQLLTDFVVGRPPSYSHAIFDEVRNFRLVSFSLLPLLGFYSQTTWDAALAGDEESIVLAMKDMSLLSLESISVLLDARSTPD